MRYTVKRPFPEATEQGLKVGDAFPAADTASAHALVQGGMLRAVPDPQPKAKALPAAPRNKDAAPLRRNK